MMLSMVKAKLLAGRACRTNRTTRAGRVTVRSAKRIVHACSQRGSLRYCWMLAMFVLALEVLEGGIGFGDAAGLDRLGHEGEAEFVVGEGVLGIVGERLLAIGDGGIEIGRLALAFAHTVPGHVVVVVPDVALGNALLAAHADQRAEHIVIQLTS